MATSTIAGMRWLESSMDVIIISNNELMIQGSKKYFFFYLFPLMRRGTVTKTVIMSAEAISAAATHGKRNLVIIERYKFSSLRTYSIVQLII